MRAYFHIPYRQKEGIIRVHTANTLPLIPVIAGFAEESSLKITSVVDVLCRLKPMKYR